MGNLQKNPQSSEERCGTTSDGLSKIQEERGQMSRARQINPENCMPHCDSCSCTLRAPHLQAAYKHLISPLQAPYEHLTSILQVPYKNLTHKYPTNTLQAPYKHLLSTLQAPYKHLASNGALVTKDRTG